MEYEIGRNRSQNREGEVEGRRTNFPEITLASARDVESRRTNFPEITMTSPSAAEATELDYNWVRETKSKLDKKPTLLVEKAGKSSCCVFRVPQGLVEIDQKAYHPRIVSIGPYHHGSDHLKMIEEHKWRFLRSLLDRNNDLSANLELCFQAVAAMEENIRDCYSESTKRFNSQELVEMMIVDGCFIIQLVCGALNVVSKDLDDPVFKIDWIMPSLMRDLLKLENQIPFFILQKLFDISIPDENETLPNIFMKFFNPSLKGPGSVRKLTRNFEGKHLFDLVRESFQPQIRGRQPNGHQRHPQVIQPANKLNRAGIKFETWRRSGSSFLDVKFSKGVLKMPPLRMDNFITCFILYCIAFEQCYGHCEKFVTNYVTFMDCLIDNPGDASFLCDHKIIENYYGTDGEVASFFDEVGKDVAFDLNKTYLSKLIEQLNEYYWNDWHVKWASFKHTYFNTPWSFMVALAVLIVLILTMLHVLFDYLAYAHLPKN